MAWYITLAIGSKPTFALKALKKADISFAHLEQSESALIEVKANKTTSLVSSFIMNVSSERTEDLPRETVSVQVSLCF